MVDFTKPSEINKIWSEAGDKTNPGDAKISQGWIVEAPPRQTFNFLINRQDAALAYLNQKGIPIWDSTTEYINGKSYVQASDGKIYRSIQTGTNQNPVAAPTFWVRAFDDFDTSYDKAESDAKYLWRANNLSDLTNTATARTNLDVYSKAEADGRYVNTSGDDAMAGSLAINGGTLSTSAVTFNLINTVATTVNFAGAATSLTIGALTGTTTIRNATTAITGNATVGGTLSVTGNSTLTGDLAVNGGDITTTAATATVFNTAATTLNIGQAATALSIGATTGTATIGNPTVVGTAATQNLYNTVATTMNFAGAATSLTIGATTGTATIRNSTTAITGNATVGGTLSVTGTSSLTGNVTVTGDVAVNGGDLTTTALTATLFNTGATTLNIGQAATTISIGATTGTTTVRNALASGNLTVTGTVVASSTVQGTQIISTVATGTAPLQVASTTKVTNLNADLLDGMDSASTNTASTIVARDASGNFAAANVTLTSLTVGTISYSGEVTTSAVSSLQVPVGTTAQRPTAANGKIRYNTTLNRYEGYNSNLADWAQLGGGAVGGGLDQVFYENGLTVTANYTITSGKSAMSTGPITINSGVTVTIPSGSRWVIL